MNILSSQIARRLSVAMLVVSICITTSASQASCTSSSDWLSTPDDAVKITINSSVGSYSLLTSNSLGQESTIFPTAITDHTLQQDGEAVPTDSMFDVSYFESNGKGAKRLCRLERWIPKGTSHVEKFDELAKTTLRFAGKHPILRDLALRNVGWSGELYFYDSRGRFERVAQTMFETPAKRPVDMLCRRYDDNDRVILSISPTTEGLCPPGEPNPRDRWRRFRYGEYKGETVILLRQDHYPKANGLWSEEISPFQTRPEPDSPNGSARIDSRHGVVEIYGSNLGELDNNGSNMVVDSSGRWRGATYTFPRPPVAIDVLQNPDLLYKYARRRQTYIDGTLLKLFELFPPKEHISRHRYYLLDGYVQRHEQLDSNGKVVRLITVDGWREPRPSPKPAVNDDLLQTRHLALLLHQVYHRVYDIDANGIPTLKALSWDRKIRTIPYKYKPKEYADLVYGTPDGKVRWKNKAEFEKTFNTSARAAHVFPEEAARD